MFLSKRQFLQIGGLIALDSYFNPAILKNMEHPLTDSSGNLNIIPSKTSSRNDFDFLVGKWKIHNQKLKTRLKNSNEWIEFEAHGDCDKTLLGSGNLDHFRTEFNRVPFEGITLRLFNPKTRLWNLYWADSSAVTLDVPVVGSFDGKTGNFYAKDVWEGTPIITQFKWEKTNPDAPVWSQAFSVDQGKNWEWNWFMTFHRQS